MYKEEIKNYKPKNEQEEKDQELILSFIDRNPDVLYRNNLAAHMTASAIVVNENMDHILFAFHKIYQSWSWVGGHHDGNPNSLEVAIKEAMEETGVTHIWPYQKEMIMIDVIQVTNHYKKGIYVPDHLHLNQTYLLIADQKDELVVNIDENSGVRWFHIDEVLNHVSEDRMIKVYQKAITFIKDIKANRNNN